MLESEHEKVLRAGEIFVLAIASQCLVFSAIVKIVRDVLKLTILVRAFRITS